MRVVTLQKIGSEYVLNIPRDIVEGLDLKAGSLLEVHPDNAHNLVLAPVQVELETVLQIHENLMDDYHSAFARLAQ